MRLLMIDDDESLADIISQHLIQQHYAVDIATNGQMGLEFVELFNYDLIILDLTLPDLDGQSICARIRQNKHPMPILMLTARDTAEDKVQGLDAGADDYIVKPIHLPELLARIRALLRRASSIATPQLQWGDLQIDPNSFETTYDGKIITLTPKEYSILELFLRHPHKSQTLDGIIDNIWALENPPSLYAIRTHIKSVRHKLKESGAPADFIETLYGFGYRLNPQYHHQNDEPPPRADSNPGSNVKKTHTITAMTQELWSKYESEMENRIDTLEHLVHSIPHQSTSDALQQGMQISHKLAGSLGCFSFQEGSKLAKQIEHRLDETAKGKPPNSQELKRLVHQLRASIHHDSTPKSETGDRRHLLVYSTDQTLLESLQNETASYGFTLTTVLDANTLLKQLKIKSPDVILLDITQNKPSLKILSLLQETAPDCPIVAILHTDQWQDRIDYIQHGVRQIFEAPVSVAQLLDVTDQIESTAHTHAKVLIVDDDRPLLSVLNSSLSTLGFDITTLNDPLRFWPTLKQTQPDLIILDIDMPDITGLDLCQLLRADPEWKTLPIMFLSSHQDPQTEDHAFIAGADDFIAKGFPVNRLALRIHNRLR